MGAEGFLVTQATLCRGERQWRTACGTAAMYGAPAAQRRCLGGCCGRGHRHGHAPNVHAWCSERRAVVVRIGRRARMRCNVQQRPHAVGRALL